jgi:hypothetical protein
MGADGTFITGSDFLMDGGVTASYWFGDLAPKSEMAIIERVVGAMSGRPPAP